MIEIKGMRCGRRICIDDNNNVIRKPNKSDSDRITEIKFNFNDNYVVSDVYEKIKAEQEAPTEQITAVAETVTFSETTYEVEYETGRKTTTVTPTAEIISFMDNNKKTCLYNAITEIKNLYTAPKQTAEEQEATAENNNDVKEEKAMKKSTKKATTTETVKTIETTAEVKEAPTAETEQTTLKKYSAFVKNEENKTEIITKDYATKKAFISDLKGNNYKICFVCLDSEYDEASKKYHETLEKKKARAKANYTTKKVIAETEKEYRKVTDVKKNDDNTYTVYFDMLTEIDVKIYKRLPKIAKEFLNKAGISLVSSPDTATTFFKVHNPKTKAYL